MKKLILISQIIIIIFSFACSSNIPKMPVAEKGVLDLNTWDFTNKGPVELNGEWEFYWNKHYSPKNFLNEHIFPTYFEVPKLWNSEEFEDMELPDTGIATYRLKILLNEPQEKLALLINKINNAYIIYANDSKVYESGKIGKDKNNTVAWGIPSVVGLESESDILYLTILVSNFHTAGGGIGEKIKIGYEQEIRSSYDKSIYATIFILGMIFILGLSNLGIFAIIRNNKSLLYLGIICLLGGLFLGLSNERILFTIFSSVSWSILYTLLSITFFLAVPSFSLFTYSLFPEEFNNILLKVIIIIGSIFALLAIVPSITLNNFLMNINQVTTIFLGIYVINVLIKAVIKKREGSIIFLTAGSIFFFMVINDILNYNQIIETALILKYGFAFLICSLSYTVTFRFSKKFIATDGLSKELEYYKKELEEKIKERTDELNSTVEELTSKNNILVETNKELKKMKEVMWDEKEIERKIQTTLSTNQHKLNDFKVFTCSMPEEKLGGNYYDIINTDDKDWIIIGDVSGHGINSGLIMLMVQTAIRVVLDNKPGLKPIELVTSVNELIGKNILILNDEKYIKLTILEIDKKNNNQMSGFHHDVLIHSKSSETVELAKSNEALLGLSDDVKNFLENDTFSLQKDDIMLLFSYGDSGLWDKKNIKKNKDPNLEKISTEKMKNLLQNNNKNSVENIYKEIEEELCKYGMNDNITVILLQKK